ncbi:DUF3887 domain-containing protein [Miniphocaeibacter halophilus]|uniref:DUF3887 domain-containing protein n=1 Tax=Miniphocaeibacter halophilus TaxID=2931922 RepID=A0AC61N0G0_9FIRM|nr:DUF3887 domain-containing protein [Miniphocaeibacter halophilus]QQK08719.1 DUF3887 domain-containing protein [Miniphocaeibacter halophilus]
MKNTKVKFILLVGLVLLVLVGCEKKFELKKFKEDEVKSKAQNIIELVNNRDYEKIYNDNISDLIKTTVTYEEYYKPMEEISKILDKLGKFKEYEKYDIIEQEENGNTYATIQYVVKYENEKAVYTLGFDEEYKLINIFIK